MSLQKNALCRGDARSDLRCYALQQFRESGLEVLLRSLYPSLMALHQLDATVLLLSLSHAQSCTFAEDPAHLPEGVRVTGEHALILPPMRNLSLAALTADLPERVRELPGGVRESAWVFAKAVGCALQNGEERK